MGQDLNLICSFATSRQSCVVFLHVEFDGTIYNSDFEKYLHCAHRACSHHAAHQLQLVKNLVRTWLPDWPSQGLGDMTRQQGYVIRAGQATTVLSSDASPYSCGGRSRTDNPEAYEA